LVTASSAALNLEQQRAYGAKLLAGNVLYFPIRHHSPACAWHVQNLIHARRPAAVLIEGPSNFTQQLPVLASQDALPPIALYTYCNLRAAESADTDQNKSRSDRRGAYYPLCGYSPEWVALRNAIRIGAEVQFIDLEFVDQTLIDKGNRLSGRTATLLSEHWFRRSAYLRALATRLRCRDTDELWDRLFECWAQETPVEQFVAQIAAYCDLARQGVTDEEHERDGTSAREAEMAWWITNASERHANKTILVITGGYHTVVLPQLVEARTARPKIDRDAIVSSDTVCVRYSFDRLDRASGYGAGMRSPAFYQRLWDADGDPASVPLTLLTDIAEQARDKGLDDAPTTASLIAALEQTRRLAAMRGNRAPTRADLWDGIESCLLQGVGRDSASALARLVTATLSGSTLGRVPAAAGLPPIVGDFYTRAREQHLRVDDTEPHKLALDIYGEERAREVSRLLHRVQYLGLPFAARLSGPNFTGPQVGRRLREVWNYGWSPMLESALIDAAAYGSTVAEAVAQKFSDEIAIDEASAPSAQRAAERIAQACQLGLHDQIPRAMAWLRSAIRNDPDFNSVVSALHRMALLWQSREPLKAVGLDSLPEVAQATFDRAVYLIGQLDKTPTEVAGTVAEGLVSLRELIVGSVAEWFDSDLLWQGVDRLATQVTGTAAVLGAANGMLYSAARVDETVICARLLTRMPEGADLREGVAYLRGVMIAAREVVWQSAQMLKTLRAIVESRSEEEFVRLLPDLRLALARLTPVETDRVAQTVAVALGQATLGQIVERQLNENEVRVNVELSVRVRRVLERDGLSHWLEDTP
jgi:hypothetical protein